MLKKIFVTFALLFIFIPVFAISSHLETESAPVFVIPVKDQIEPGWLLFFKNSIELAKKTRAKAIILEMDTPGGFIDTALKAKNLIDGLTIPIYSYINRNALSAGAYLALTTNGFYMATGSTIGAAEPILLNGKPADEKILSFWEAEMRSAAEKQGKDPLLAAAMVRRSMVIKELAIEGELLTLTTLEAEKLSFSDGTVNSITELLDKIGFSNSEIIYCSPSFWEQITTWLINPVIATMLLMLGFFFMVVEIITPGFGLGGLLSLLAFSLYFGGHFLTGISGWPAIVLFLFGIILLSVEAFIPGFGIFGIIGLFAVIISIALTAASTTTGIYSILISLIMAAIASFLAYKYFQKKGTLKKIILSESATREAGYSSSLDYSYLSGKEGKTITPLRPAGIVLIDGEKYDTISESGYINPGEIIIVSKVQGYKIVVRQKN